MNFKEELYDMQRKYEENRLLDIKITRPTWLTSQDPMSQIYTDKKTLLQNGEVVYSCIVQANTILFKVFPYVDCPAHVVYSTDAYVAERPEILFDVANNLYQYKGRPLYSVPKKWREIARVITDELDRTDFTFIVEYHGHPIEFHLLPTMIFRKLLPKRKLCSSLLPILTTPKCKTILILPPKYWSIKFKELWCKGRI